MTTQHADYLIIGGGIVGLAIARELHSRFPKRSIILIEKEEEVARHGSGRNSGVLHAGFYYTADSLKARFARDGNAAMRRYCEERGLPINPCKKVVVAMDEAELETLHELYRRGQKNGVDVSLMDEKELAEFEPNAHTYGKALFSPNTATVDPAAVSLSIRRELAQSGVTILPGHGYQTHLGSNRIQAGGVVFEAGKIINCAGLYADRIARDFGFCEHYTIVPFKGIYVKYTGKDKPIKTNIYPVPNLKNPFLGVHFTIAVDGTIKIGPTAIPAFWRENYQGLSRFNAREMAEILRWEAELFARDAFGFRKLAFEEMRKYQKSHLVGLAMKMVKKIDASGFTDWSRPGIRAQLLDKRNLSLVQDFVVEGDANSIHVLNAISPAFTCSLPFASWVVDSYIEKSTSLAPAA